MTELEVRFAAQSYGAWSGASQALLTMGLVGAVLSWLEVETGWLAWTATIVGIAATVYWRRAAKAYRAAWMAQHERELASLREEYEETKRVLEALREAQ